MSAIAYTPDHSCRRRDIAVMDHRIGLTNGTARPIVNRMCLTCGAHWYGDAEAAVFEIPEKVWDGWMNQPEVAA